MARTDDPHRDHGEQFMRPGLFKLRLGKGMPLLPAIIWRPCPIEMHADAPWQWLDRWPALQAAYDVTAFGNWLTPCEPYQIWLGGKEIDMHELRYWVATRQHIKLYEPDAIDADPRKKIDLSTAAPIMPRFE